MFWTLTVISCLVLLVIIPFIWPDNSNFNNLSDERIDQLLDDYIKTPEFQEELSRAKWTNHYIQSPKSIGLDNQSILNAFNLHNSFKVINSKPEEPEEKEPDPELKPFATIMTEYGILRMPIQLMLNIDGDVVKDYSEATIAFAKHPVYGIYEINFPMDTWKIHNIH